MNNPIGHFAISSKFKNCLLDLYNKRGVAIGFERDYHLMVAYVRLCVASATSGRVGELQPPKFKINRLYDLSVTSGAAILLIKPQIENNALENINEL